MPLPPCSLCPVQPLKCPSRMTTAFHATLLLLLHPQVGLFTATMPESLQEVAAAWLHRPERVAIHASAASISRSVTQVVQVCAEHKKPAKLVSELGGEGAFVGWAWRSDSQLLPLAC